MTLNFIDICTQLESWFESPRGRYLLAQEQQLSSDLLHNVFGYHQLQLGATRKQPLALESRLGHRIYCNSQPGDLLTLQSEPGCLPFANDSIDAIVLHHALDFADDPHGLLREVHRVLAHQGQIIVFGFNPVSLFGAGTRIAGLRPGSIWRQAHHLSIFRLRDWLHLLGAEVQETRHCFAMPPAGGERLFKGLSHCDRFAGRYKLPVGGVYAIRAIKKVSTLTPTREGWRRKVGARLIGLAAPNPVPSPRSLDSAA